MRELLIKYIIFITIVFCTSIELEAQKQSSIIKKISKDSFKSFNKIPFEITRYRVGSPLKISEIKGFSPENYECKKPSIYIGFLGCSEEGTTAKIIGSSFGKQQGNGFINCSEQKVKVTINSWNENEININVIAIDKYLETRKVILTLMNDNLEQVSFAIDVIGILKVKGVNNTDNYYSYGQNIWSIVKNRMLNELPMPETLTTSTGPIDEKYEPKLWDCILFENGTMGIIIKCSSKNTEIVNEHEQNTWSIILEEMNTKCAEKKSVVICKFQLGNTITDGSSYKYGIILNIGSSAVGNIKAVAYFR
jgi:hypothetical protein